VTRKPKPKPKRSEAEPGHFRTLRVNTRVSSILQGTDGTPHDQQHENAREIVRAAVRALPAGLSETERTDHLAAALEAFDAELERVERSSAPSTTTPPRRRRKGK
jgi:uncharacterized membrane protein YccC